MNDLLFYALILALLYYFFYYLPKQKQTEPIKPTPLTHTQSTQTNPDPQPTEDNSELESTLDNLISEIKKLNQQLK